MTYDTITLNGVEKTFADWNLDQSNLHASFKNQAADTLQISITNRNIATEADAPTCAFESQAVIRVNRTGAGTTWTGGTIKFVGKRIQPPLKASGSGHRVSYTFQGPWYDLANSDYQQTFKGGDGVVYFSPEVVLFTSTAVATGSIIISVGDQLQAIAQWVLDQYAQQGMAAPFQYKGRAMNAGKIDLNSNSSVVGTAGGNYSFQRYLFNYHLQAGQTIDASLYSLFLPTFIERPMRASTCIQKCLELSPRVNVWFDYTTMDGSGNPLPTLCMTLVDNMPAVNATLFTGFVAGGATHKDVDIQARDDLMIRAAVIKYKITGQYNGQTQVCYVVDKRSAAGFGVNLDNTGNNVTDPNSGLRVLNDIIDLTGTSVSTLTGYLDLEPVLVTSYLARTTSNTSADQSAKRTWWASKRGGELSRLEDSRVRFQTYTPNLVNPLNPTLTQTYIPDAVIVDAATGATLSPADLIAAGLCDSSGNLVLNRIVRGAYHGWMKRLDGQPVVSKKIKIMSKMVFAEYTSLSASGTPDMDQAGHVVNRANSSEEHVNIEVTNATPDVGVNGLATFSILESTTPGELYIVGAGGIADYLWNHFNVRQYDGNFCKIESNFTDSSTGNYLNLGRRLNLTNGAAAWQSMNAQIQEIVEDYGACETTVKIGVAKHLNAGQLSSLLNMFRNRRSWSQTTAGKVFSDVQQSGLISRRLG